MSLAPGRNTFELGAYDGAVIYSDLGLFGSVEKPKRTAAARFIEKFNSAEIFILELNQSHDNFLHCAYALYQNGKEVRAFMGAKRGRPRVYIDRGAPLPEEQQFYDKSFLQDGQRIFFRALTDAELTNLQKKVLDLKIQGAGQRLLPRKLEYDHVTAAGYYLSDYIASRFFGSPLREYDGDLYLERFYKIEIPWWNFLRRIP